MSKNPAVLASISIYTWRFGARKKINLLRSGFEIPILVSGSRFFRNPSRKGAQIGMEVVYPHAEPIVNYPAPPYRTVFG